MANKLPLVSYADRPVSRAVETPAAAGLPILTDPPEILSPSAFTVPENQIFALLLLANKPVFWTKTGGADAAAFTLIGGLLTFGAKDFELPTDANGDNAYVVRVTATDLFGNATTQTIVGTVTNVIEGALPTITPTSGTVDIDAAASTIVLDLPALGDSETRTYVPTTGPAFAISTAGDLIRGAAPAAAGTATGKIRQTRGGITVDTAVTVALTDAPQPPAGFLFLTGADGALLLGADGALLYSGA